MKRCLVFLSVLFLSTSFLFSHEIKAIVFDCGGVIVQYNRSDAVKFLAESFEISPSEVVSYLSKEEKYSDLSIGKIKEAVFWENFAKKNQLSLPSDFYRKYLTFMKNFAIQDKAMIDLVKHLQNSGFQTPMLSNVTEWQTDGFTESGLYQYFSPVLLSCEIGLRKPDPAIYHYLLTQLNLPPEACIFVDDKERNISAAKELGIDAITFTSLDGLKGELKKRGIE